MNSRMKITLFSISIGANQLNFISTKKCFGP
jgi:hypothetical protein